MTGRWIIGVDPGRTVGICALDLVVPDRRHFPDAGPRIVGDPWLFQCTPEAAEWVVTSMVNQYPGAVLRIAVEHYVSGLRSAKTRDRGAQDITRDLIGQLAALARNAEVPLARRPAMDVKAWATDKRLTKAGITAPVGTGYRHALDAARHALYCARFDCGVPDPLSRT